MVGCEGANEALEGLAELDHALWGCGGGGAAVDAFVRCGGCFDVKAEVQDCPECAAFVGDHRNGGDLEFQGNVVFDVPPFDDADEAFGEFGGRFLVEGFFGPRVFCRDMWSFFERCKDGWGGPIGPTVCRATLVGVRSKEGYGRVCGVGTIGVHEFMLTYFGFDGNVRWDVVGVLYFVCQKGVEVLWRGRLEGWYG